MNMLRRATHPGVTQLMTSLHDHLAFKDGTFDGFAARAAADKWLELKLPQWQSCASNPFVPMMMVVCDSWQSFLELATMFETIRITPRTPFSGNLTRPAHANGILASRARQDSKIYESAIWCDTVWRQAGSYKHIKHQTPSPGNLLSSKHNCCGHESDGLRHGLEF